MEFTHKGGARTSLTASEVHAGNSLQYTPTHPLSRREAPRNLALKPLLPNDVAARETEACQDSRAGKVATNAPLRPVVFDHPNSGPQATLRKEVTGHPLTQNPVVDCQPYLPTVDLNAQPLPVYEHINTLVRNIMRPAETLDILPLIPFRSPPQTRRHRIVGEWPALLSREQLCEYLDISPASLAKVCPVQPIDWDINTLRWRRTEIDRWLSTLSPRSSKRHSHKPTQFDESAPLEVLESSEERREATLARVRKATGARR